MKESCEKEQLPVCTVLWERKKGSGLTGQNCLQTESGSANPWLRTLRIVIVSGVLCMTVHLLRLVTVHKRKNSTIFLQYHSLVFVAFIFRLLLHLVTRSVHVVFPGSKPEPRTTSRDRYSPTTAKKRIQPLLFRGPCFLSLLLSTHEFGPLAGVEVVLEEVAQAVRPVVPTEHVHGTVVNGARVEVSRGGYVACDGTAIAIHAQRRRAAGG